MIHFEAFLHIINEALGKRKKSNLVCFHSLRPTLNIYHDFSEANSVLLIFSNLLKVNDGFIAVQWN